MEHKRNETLVAHARVGKIEAMAHLENLAMGSREKSITTQGSNGTTLALGSWSENWTLMLRKKMIEKGEPDATVLIINKEEPIILPECI